MAVQHLLFLILFYLAAGFFVSMGFLKPSQMGSRYFLIHGLGASACALGAYYVWAIPGEGTGFRGAFLAFVVLSAVYSLTAGRVAWLSLITYFLGIGACLMVIVADLQAAYPQGSQLFAGQWFFISNAVLSALLLGFTMAAMLVGHWYLIQPKLSILELSRVTWIFILLVILRFAFGTYGLFLLMEEKSEIEVYRYLFSGHPGLFVLMRWCWGLLGPLVLCYFIWNTVRIRSTQSATGILYVAVICVLAGEILSQYLTFYHGIPM